jgi:peptidoglycan hydrolase-like protein with peptidoglycan-binding domain
VTARFITEDTYRGQINDPLSLNLYTYCVKNPIRYTDPSGHRTLKEGCEGGDVENMQEMLIALGYDLGEWGADGDFGSKTDEAVRQFQRDYHLEDDGKVGPQTSVTLGQAYGAYTASMGIAGNKTLAAMNEAYYAKNGSKNAGSNAGSSSPAVTSGKSTTEVTPPQIAGHDNLGYLSGYSESGSNPGTISTGNGDSGGKSYGAFQFSSNNNVPQAFMNWLKNNNTSMYNQLYSAFKKDGRTLGSNFDATWRNLAQNNSDQF